MAPARRTLLGIGVSAGAATGPAVVVRPAVAAPPDEPAAVDIEAAADRLARVLEEVAVSLEARAAHADDTARAVLEATAMMARDPGLLTEVRTRIEAGLGPAQALAAAVEKYASLLTQMGGYMAERVADLHDVRDRATARLLGVPEPGVPDLEAPCVVVARDLAPAETATLDRELVRGIVTEAGGPTSHTAILAAQLGIPAVVQAAGALGIEPGASVALDGTTGEVVVEPTAKESATLAGRAEARAALLESSSGPGRTRDDHAMPLLANIGTVEDARQAAATDAEGVGLFRTEFLFLGRCREPSREEQVQTYTEVFEAFGGRRVVVRTLDAGADKPLAFASLGPEENPALGRRGVRLSRALPELLTTQLAAIAEATGATGADVRVMAPMVAGVEEARWFAAQVKAAGLPQAGVMVEVPAAALRARDVLREVDFASIGTNDLQQYVMAADRMEGGLADLLDPWQPAVLDLVATACAGGRDVGVPVGVCGESAGAPLLALVLVGMGASSLSMAPSRIAAVRAALAGHDLATCQAMAQGARQAPTPAEARAAALALAEESARALLL
jgi:phosphotransferase system enzyme I (PtsI)